MSALEEELIEIIHKMDEAQQRQMLGFARKIEAQQPVAENWSGRARALRLKLREKYGVNHFADNQDILDEVREERLDDLMGGE